MRVDFCQSHAIDPDFGAVLKAAMRTRRQHAMLESRLVCS
jgi:hypothetical protein